MIVLRIVSKRQKFYVAQIFPKIFLSTRRVLCTSRKLETTFTNKEFLCITHTVEHNYISSSSTLGLQLHISAIYVVHLQVVT